MLQNATALRKSAPWPPNISWTCLLYCACHSKCIFADPLQMSHACHRFWKCHKNLTFCSLLTRCTIPCACHAKRELNVQKWSVRGVLCTFWLRNALHATMACTFSTSQLPSMVCFVHFDFEMCFAPQRRAIFLLSSDQMAPHPLALASLLFDPPEPQIFGKTQCFATFLPFRASASSFFWLFLFSDLLSSTLLFSLTLPISAFHLSILSEVWLLNFPRLFCIIQYYCTLFTIMWYCFIIQYYCILLFFIFYVFNKMFLKLLFYIVYLLYYDTHIYIYVCVYVCIIVFYIFLRVVDLPPIYSHLNWKSCDRRSKPRCCHQCMRKRHGQCAVDSFDPSRLMMVDGTFF